MDSTIPIMLSEKDGYRFWTPLLPTRWKGETNCVVGPFSGRDVAEYFAGYASDFGQYESYSYKVFPKRDAWYVKIEASQEQRAQRGEKSREVLVG
jgi:hypothetical protein